MIILRPYQNEMKTRVYHAWDSGFKNTLLVLPTGGGKCLGENTPILMFDGSIKMSQNIKKGDLLMGPDSKPKTVLSTVKGSSDLYEITPVKGDSWVCNDVHVLTLKHTETKVIIDIPLDEYLEKSKNFKHLHKQFRVGVEFPYRDVEFDPYLLGVYLAEGCHSHNSLTTSDNEIFDYCIEWSKKHDMNNRIVQGSGCHMIHFADNEQGWYKNKIKKLRKYCTTKYDRWIPKEYLYNSREVRLEVLAGLLDGDGYLHHGMFEIITKYPTLCDDILYLARSLGFAAYVSITNKRIKSSGYENAYFRITISGNLNLVPNKVPKKKCPVRRQIKDVLNTGFTVKNLGRGDYYGFELDGDGRFLLGDFTVTHNTKTFCSIVSDTLQTHTTAIMVHRKELVQQICLTLSNSGIYHNIIASRQDIKGIIAAERRMYNQSFYNAHSTVSVISVDTLIARKDVYSQWVQQVTQVITDEAAHVLRENKWGVARSMFVNARSLGVTATPERLDRKGLGSHVDGIYDVMIEGPPTRWMIDQGYLSKYKIVCPPSDFAQHLDSKTDTSDYSKQTMINASNKSRIVGDVVENYIKFASGKQAILFATDINTAYKMEEQFNSKGVIAKALDGTTKDSERLDALIRFREKEIQVLINVDLFDEGLDVPGIEVVIMARPTKSLGKFLQCVGRGLRIQDGKSHMLLIDHVGNVKYHDLPCKIRRWTLDRTNKRAQKLNFVRICSNVSCNSPYDKVLTECPWCGEAPPKPDMSRASTIREALEVVDGDLVLLDPAVLRNLEGRVILEDPANVAKRVSDAVNPAAGLKAMRNQQERIATQAKLVQAIAEWAGVMKHRYKYTDRQIHKKFYIHFMMTITEALAEPKAQMEETIIQLGDLDDY